MPAKILVVDDEAPIANVVALKLRNAGLGVTVAYDGEEALGLALQDRPDFIITDLQMPGMSGIELCALLAAEIPGGVPAFLLTGKGFEVDARAVAHLPIRRIMTKPFSPKELLTRVLEELARIEAAENPPEGFA